jgi:hypothetical protein
VDTPRPSTRTNRTRRVPHPVLIGHAAAAPQVPAGSADIFHPTDFPGLRRALRRMSGRRAQIVSHADFCARWAECAETRCMNGPAPARVAGCAAAMLRFVAELAGADARRGAAGYGGLRLGTEDAVRAAARDMPGAWCTLASCLTVRCGPTLQVSTRFWRTTST